MIRYIPGSPVRGEDFYDRKSQLQTIMDGGWTWVCGQRRIGKTSLLFHLEEKASEQNSLPLFFDLTTLEEYSGEGLFEIFWLSHRKSLKEHDIRMKEFPLKHPVECFYQLISDLGEKGLEVTFLWDEAEKLIELEQKDPGILNKLRARLSHLRNFRFVISATQLLTELYEQQSELVSSFLHTFHWLPLPVLDSEEARSLLKCEQIGGWATPLPETVIDEAVHWSGGHPLILHELGSQLAERTQYNGRIANSELLRVCFNHLSHNVNLRNIFQDDYAKLTDDQQHVLKRLIDASGEMSLEALVSDEHTSVEKIEDALRFLVNYSYVAWETDNEIRLRFVFYPQFVQLDTPPPSVSNQRKVNQIKRTVFIAYHQEDRDSLKMLRTHLDPLFRKGEIEIWDDVRLAATTHGEGEIEGALRRAQVVILMISPDFLNAEVLKNRDLLNLLAKADQKGCRVLCLFLKSFTGVAQASQIETPPLPADLHQKIVDFLLSLPNIDDTDAQRALIYGASLDTPLRQQITFPGSSVQFFQLLMETLRSYGMLEDGRDALIAVLESAKTSVGQDRRKHCDTLIQELQEHGRLFSYTKFQWLNDPNQPLNSLSEAENAENLKKWAEDIVWYARNMVESPA